MKYADDSSVMVCYLGSNDFANTFASMTPPHHSRWRLRDASQPELKKLIQYIAHNNGAYVRTSEYSSSN